MRRLKTRHSYHDAGVRAVEFGAGDGVVFEVELCSCSGSPGAVVHLSFHGVKNLEEVRRFVEAIPGRPGGRTRIAEVVGLARADDRSFLLDLDRGPLYVRAKGFTET